MPHPAVVAGCVVGSIAAAIAFEVAIFKPWRDRYGQEVLHETVADLDRFRMEFRENFERLMGRRSHDDEVERDIREIEEFELAMRQSEQTARDRQAQIDREWQTAQSGEDQGLRRRRAYVEDEQEDDSAVAVASRQDKGKGRAVSPGPVDFTAPHHALGDETPSTLPDSPPWPVQGTDADDSFSTSSAVMVEQAPSSPSWSSPSLPPALHPKPYEYRPENLSRSQLNNGGHEDWTTSSSLSLLSHEAPSGPASHVDSNWDSDSEVDEEEEEEQLHSSLGLSSPPRLAPLSPPLSDFNSAGWSDLEHASIRSPSDWQGDSDFGDGSSNASEDHEDDHIVGGSGSAVDSGLLIESLDTAGHNRGNLGLEHL